MARKYCCDLIVSDVHVGSPLCRTEAFLDTMSDWSFNRLIIAGDLLHRPRLAYKRSEILRWIGSLSSKKVWVVGNHDRDRETYPRDHPEWVRNTTAVYHLSRRLGMDRVASSYELEWAFGSCIVVHGDQFDPFVGNRSGLEELVSRVFFGSLESARLLFDYPDQRMFRLFRELSEDLVTHFDDVSRRARTFAKENGYRYIVKGHTHRVAEEFVDGVTRLNPGCWEDIFSGFVTYVDGEEPQLHLVG